MIRASKNKASVLKRAKAENKNRLWQDEEGKWHAVHGDENVPHWAVKVEEIK